MVLYSQRDPKWANYIYSAKKPHTETLKSSGCGVTCAASVVSSLDNIQVTPPEMADYSLENGFRIDGEGTANELFFSVAKKYDLYCKETTKANAAIDCINQKGMAVCGTTGGAKKIFSTGGHFFILLSKEGEWLKFWDPDHYKGKYKQNDRQKYARTDSDGFVYVKEIDAIPEINRYFCFNAPKIEEEETMKKIYHYTAEIPDWGRPTIQMLLDKEYFSGRAPDDLDLSEDMLRIFVTLNRAGVFDK